MDVDEYGNALSLQQQEKKRQEHRERRVPADFANILSLQLSRTRMSLWCHMPFFADFVVGRFVRIGIGMHDGEQVYRCARIKQLADAKVVLYILFIYFLGFPQTAVGLLCSAAVEQKVYVLEKTKSDKALTLQFGNSTRNFRMEYVSNNPITESEVPLAIFFFFLFLFLFFSFFAFFILVVEDLVF